MKKNMLGLAVFLLLFGAFYRVFRLQFLPDFPNFAPVMAIALCGGLFLPPRIAFAITFPALLASDIFLSAHYGEPLFDFSMIGIYACYLFAILAGQLMKDSKAVWIFTAAAGSSFLFYLVTNTLAWFGNPEYPQTVAGLFQSLTVGRPGFAPTWMFFRNSLISDLIFTAVFVAAFHLSRNRIATPNLCRQESSSCPPPAMH